jgi:hypothetical protein
LRERQLIELGAGLLAELNEIKTAVEHEYKDLGRSISFTDPQEKVRTGYQLEGALEVRAYSCVSAMLRHDPLGTQPAFCLRGVIDDGRWLFVLARSMDMVVLCGCERIEQSGKYGWTRWSYATHLDAERHRLMHGTPREILAQVVGMERWLTLFKDFPSLHRDPDAQELAQLQKEVHASIETTLRQRTLSDLLHARAFGGQF